MHSKKCGSATTRVSEKAIGQSHEGLFGILRDLEYLEKDIHNTLLIYGIPEYARKLGISLLPKVSSFIFGKPHLYLHGPLLGDCVNSWKGKPWPIIADTVSGLEGFWAANCWRLGEDLGNGCASSVSILSWASTCDHCQRQDSELSRPSTAIPAWPWSKMLRCPLGIQAEDWWKRGLKTVCGALCLFLNRHQAVKVCDAARSPTLNLGTPTATSNPQNTWSLLPF